MLRTALEGKPENGNPNAGRGRVWNCSTFTVCDRSYQSSQDYCKNRVSVTFGTLITGPPLLLSVRSISMPPPWLSLLLVSEWAVSSLKCFLTGRNEGKEHDQQNHILGECLRGWWCIVVFELEWLRIVRFLTERTLYGTLMVDICHYTFVQTHRMNTTSGEPWCKL